MSRNLWLLITLLIVCFLIGVVREANAAEGADVIVLDDSCRLIKKPQAKAKPKKTSFVIQWAKPASAPVPTTKPVAKRSALPKSLRPATNPDYDLQCDEVKRPPVIAAVEPPPFEPPPLIEAPPEMLPPMTITPLPTEYEITSEPTGLGALCCVAGYIPLPVPVVRVLAPVPLVPEPETWALLVAGLTAVAVFRMKRNA